MKKVKTLKEEVEKMNAEIDKKIRERDDKKKELVELYDDGDARYRVSLKDLKVV
jgi:hypothetical protein